MEIDTVSIPREVLPIEEPKRELDSVLDALYGFTKRLSTVNGQLYEELDRLRGSVSRNPTTESPPEPPEGLFPQINEALDRLSSEVAIIEDNVSGITNL